MQHAARLYASGVVPTKKAAALALGLKPVSFYQATSKTMGSPLLLDTINNTTQQVAERTVDVGALLARLSVEAIGTIDHIRRNGTSEDIRLKAAIDLADRGPQTSKVQKHQVESFTLDGKDVEAIRRAMVESIQVAQLTESVAGHFEQVSTTEMKDDK